MGVLEKDGPRDIPGLSAEIILEFESEEMAESILRSVEVDNYEFISCRRDGRRLVCESLGTPGSLLHTLDDFLSCVITAESVYRST